MSKEVTVTTTNQWSEFATAWAKLDLSHSAETFFQELEIQKVWWESMGQPPLKVIIVSEADTPVGIFPLCQVGTRLQLLGDQDVTDYLDVLVTPGKETEVWDALGSQLADNSEWSSLLLVSLPQHSSSFSYLESVAQKNHWQYNQVQQDVCPIIELPPTWEEYLNMIGKKQRHEVTRKWKRLTEQVKVEFRVVTEAAVGSTELETFFTLHRQSSLEKAAFWTPEHKKYFELLTEATSKAGWLRLYFLDINNEPAAAMYCFEYQESLLIYNSGFNAEKFMGMSVGNVLTSFTIQDAIKLGKKKYDFLRGGEEYKFRYRAVPHPVLDVSVQRVTGS